MAYNTLRAITRIRNVGCRARKSRQGVGGTREDGREQGQVFAVRKRRDKDETGNKRITDQAASQTQQVGGLVSLLYSTTSKGSHRKITTTRWFNFAFGHVRTIRGVVLKNLCDW